LSTAIPAKLGSGGFFGGAAAAGGKEIRVSTFLSGNAVYFLYIRNK